MRIIVAPDSFKECLEAPEVARAIARGWAREAPQDTLVEMPLADGGEGTTAALVSAAGGRLEWRTVSGPLAEPVEAHFGLIDDGRTAIVEVAQASGLHRVPPDRRDALRACSRGTGELIEAALASGAETLIIGLGGSATSDAGIGLLQALGARFLDADGLALSGGGALQDLVHFDIEPVQTRLQGVRVLVASDVRNPLLGPEGCARVFAPQKGASVDEVLQLETGMAHFAELARQQGFDIAGFAGSGAAGGIGGTLGGLLGASIVSGIDTVMDAVGLPQALAGADLVITGEGSLDSQSAAGKVPAGVCRLAREHGVPVIALAGLLGSELDALYDIGLTAAFSISRGPGSKADALRGAADNLALTAGNLARLWGSGSGSRA
ncbi:MAG: glycerate kinase [Pseudomonadales bacterium]|nr:glycerate kinase [Pseudomonadales bacterium]MCP5358637.1 glycerate kinase [Pseudomonadales bacterium]